MSKLTFKLTLLLALHCYSLLREGRGATCDRPTISYGESQGDTEKPPSKSLLIQEYKQWLIYASQSSMFQILNTLIRSSTETREAVLNYFARIISLNVRRAGMQVSANVSNVRQLL